jgi:hypothetical protein
MKIDYIIIDEETTDEVLTKDIKLLLDEILKLNNRIDEALEYLYKLKDEAEKLDQYVVIRKKEPYYTDINNLIKILKGE